MKRFAGYAEYRIDIDIFKQVLELLGRKDRVRPFEKGPGHQ
jgi:hypothetical protein